MHRRERSNLGQARVQQYAAGAEMAEGEYQAGDFVLTSNKTLFGWLIRLGQRLVYWGRNRPYAHWSHAAMITSGKGDLIEALVTGVERTHISKYKNVEYHVVRLDPDFLRAYRWVGMAGMYRPTGVGPDEVRRSIEYLKRGFARFPESGELAWELAHAWGDVATSLVRPLWELGYS